MCSRPRVKVGGGGVVTVSLGLHRSDCVGVGSLTPRLAAAQGEGGGGAAALAQLAPLARVAWRALLGLRCSARVGWRCWLALLGWRRRWLASLACVALLTLLGSRRWLALLARVARLASGSGHRRAGLRCALAAQEEWGGQRRSRCSACIWVGPLTRRLVLRTHGPGGMGGGQRRARCLARVWVGPLTHWLALRARGLEEWGMGSGARVARLTSLAAKGEVGGGQRRSRRSTHTRWCWRVVGGSVLAGELAAILGRQWLFIGSCASARLLQVGVGAGGLEGRCGWGINGGALGGGDDVVTELATVRW